MRMIAGLISPTQGQEKILYHNRLLTDLNPGEWRYLNCFMGHLGSGNVVERATLGGLAKSSNRGNSYSFKGADCSSSLVSLDSTLGVAIGRNPRLAQILQPLVQIAATVPATALFPVLLIALTQIGGGLQIGSIALMML